MIYNNVKEIARMSSISIYRIEKDVGLANGTISKWNSSVPSVNSLKKVAGYLNVTIEALLDTKEENHKCQSKSQL